MLTIELSFLEDEPEIDWIIDYEYVWIKMILKFMLFSKMRSKKRQFLQMFYKKFWDCIRSLFWPIHVWVNWIGSDFLKLLELLIMPIIVESVFSEGIVVAVHLRLLLQLTHLKKCEQDSSFRVSSYGSLSWSWLYNIKLYFCSFQFYVACCILGISCHACGTWKWYVPTFSNSCTKGF